MASLNKVQLIGNLGRDPDIRYLPDGTAAAQISIATSKSWLGRNGGGATKREATEWHRVVFYRGLAKVVSEHLVQGSTVYVEGELRTRKWEDKDGSDRYTTEIVAGELIMLGGKRKDGGHGEPVEGRTFRSGSEHDEA